jgi:carboxylate-amine ligase
VPFEDPAPRLVEENMWRAIRYGLDGALVDLERAVEYPAAGVVDRLLSWTAPMRAELGLEVALPELNGAQRQRRLIDAGAGIEEVYAATVRETRGTYAQEVIV